jgi:hypothetical protein
MGWFSARCGSWNWQQNGTNAATTFVESVETMWLNFAQNI